MVVAYDPAVCFPSNAACNPPTSETERITAPVFPATEVTGILNVCVLADVTRPFASIVRTGIVVDPPYVPAETPTAGSEAVNETSTDPSNIADPVTSPLITMVRAVDNFVAVLALPSNDAVIVPALKFPEASRLTITLGEFADAASAISEETRITSPVFPATPVTGKVIGIEETARIRPLLSVVILGICVVDPYEPAVTPVSASVKPIISLPVPVTSPVNVSVCDPITAEITKLLDVSLYQSETLLPAWSKAATRSSTASAKSVTFAAVWACALILVAFNVPTVSVLMLPMLAPMGVQ